MPEVRAFCDHLTILRNGRHIATGAVGEFSDAEIIEKIIGRSISQTFPERPARSGAEAPEVFGIRNLAAGDKLHDASLSLRKGEILGVAGLQGMGQLDLFMASFGMRDIHSGGIMIDGRPVTFTSPRDAIRPNIGKESVTFYEVIESFRGFSLLKLRPQTGRTHQIRVHLLYIKHPIVADDMYGGKLVYPWQLKDEETIVEEPIISRFALHASTLEFKHPTTEEMVKFEAPLHQDMQYLLDMLRKYRKL